MGRGRAKAKQTKVARQLKYSSGSTDLDALRKELASGSTAPADDANATEDHDLDAENDLDENDLDGQDDDEDDDVDGPYGATGSP